MLALLQAIVMPGRAKEDMSIVVVSSTLNASDSIVHLESFHCHDQLSGPSLNPFDLVGAEASSLRYEIKLKKINAVEPKSNGGRSAEVGI